MTPELNAWLKFTPSSAPADLFEVILSLQAENATLRRQLYEVGSVQAAAPELLEACRAFVEWYNVDSTEQKRDDAFYAAQAAIAKALGRPVSE